MDYRRPSTVPQIPDECHGIGARYADQRGGTSAMAGLEATMSSPPVEVLYPGTAKLSGGLLASLITTPDLDPNYVQRFQNIAIIAQLADAILSVAQATGKCVVPMDFDSNGYTEGCSCETCINNKSMNSDGDSSSGDNEKEIDVDKGKNRSPNVGASTSTDTNFEKKVEKKAITTAEITCSGRGLITTAIAGQASNNAGTCMDAGRNVALTADDTIAATAARDNVGQTIYATGHR
ncbi:hypothetical protein BDZ91DRAFT_792122 [Kalaharituber pfeilii]|nr:hypothetical protein BDZ91DRAFT_792122 [Kalaharituber pfeilii]